jgi:glutathione synthase
MRFVVIMDPVSTVRMDGDTSFALMEELQARGHRVDHCLDSDLFLDGGKLHARVAQARMQRDPSAPITLGPQEDVCLHEVDAVLMRTDPPFDDNYLWASQLLDVVKADTFVMNDPHGLRQANEKLYACTFFPELMPETLVTSHKQRIREFVTRVGGRAVLKPLGGMGGAGVFVLNDGDPNLNAIIEATTQDGARAAMAQVYLPAIKTAGDKRILVLDGQPLGALLRKPAGEEVRSNLRVGGSAVKTEITHDERKIVETLAPRLRQDGLWFVGIDLIGGKLTEVNVTSPTGIQAMSRLDDVNYCVEVVDWLERRVG